MEEDRTEATAEVEAWIWMAAVARSKVAAGMGSEVEAAGSMMRCRKSS